MSDPKNRDDADTENNVTGVQNNVGRDQYNAGRDLHVHNYPEARPTDKQTIAGVWQWYDRGEDCYQPKIHLRPDAEGVAIAVSTRSDIASDVNKYLRRHKQDLDILVVTNTDDPEHSVGLPPNGGAEWTLVVDRFKDALAYIKKKGSRPIHFFFIGPLAMAFALGASVGNRHNVYVYHRQNDEYHLVYEIKSGQG